MKMLRLYLPILVLSLFVGVVAVIPQKTYAATTSSTSSGPKVTFSYVKPNFNLTVTQVKKVTYSIEYVRLVNGRAVLEGIQGGGKASANNTFTKRIYAGTQSSRYFIPHLVKEGTIKLRLTKLDGTVISRSVGFTGKGR